MSELLIIWLTNLNLWLLDGKPSIKAILNPKRSESAINNVRSDGWDG